MNFILNFLPIHRSNKSVWQISSWCWPGSVAEGGFLAPKAWLRLFLLLKLVTVLLLPHSADFPLLVGSLFGLRVLLLLRSPHISTKPSTVFLGQLALTDILVLLHWMLRLGSTLTWWTEEAGYAARIEGEFQEGGSVWWREAVSVLCQQLLDAHHLASLLLLGLLGLEATLVSRWPQQTRRYRTSRWAQLSCNLVWILVLLELWFSLNSKLSHQTYSSTLENSPTSLGLSSLPGLSSCLRRSLWLVNLWLHYAVLYSRPQKRKSFFH